MAKLLSSILTASIVPYGKVVLSNVGFESSLLPDGELALPDLVGDLQRVLRPRNNILPTQTRKY
jgi:hypothetical protein